MWEALCKNQISVWMANTFNILGRVDHLHVLVWDYKSPGLWLFFNYHFNAGLLSLEQRTRSVVYHHGEDVSRYRQQTAYLYKREFFEIHSWSLLPHFSGICCLFGNGLEWSLTIFSLYAIRGYLSPFSSHRASFLTASLCLPFSSMRYSISHPKKGIMRHLHSQLIATKTT